VVSAHRTARGWRAGPRAATGAAARAGRRGLGRRRARPARRPAAQGPRPGAAGRPAVHGAGEAVIADADGRLLEGAYTSLLWWEGETLWAVPDDAPILPGITRELLIELARARGTPVAQRRPRPHELAGRETWLVSALHGIRAVTRWAGGGLPAVDAPRAAAWQRLLDGLGHRQGV